MSTSSNGTTWTAPVRIPIDVVTSTVDHFLPGIAVKPGTSGTTAVLALTYYFYPQANCTSSTCQLEYGIIESTEFRSFVGSHGFLADPAEVSCYVGQDDMASFLEDN